MSALTEDPCSSRQIVPSKACTEDRCLAQERPGRSGTRLVNAVHTTWAAVQSHSVSGVLHRPAHRSEGPGADWTAFWDAAEEIGIPIHVHLSPGGLHSLTPKLGSWEMPPAVAVVPMQLDETLSGLIFSGILEKPPRTSTWPHSRKALAESPLALHGTEVLGKVTC